MELVAGAKAALTRARTLAWNLRRPDTETYGVRALLYHRVSDEQDPLAVTPQQFRRQMEYLAQEGFLGVDIVSALDQLSAGTLEPGAVAITFDDGYSDVGDNALPVLRELGFSATVFVATSVTSGRARYWWDSEAKLLTTDEIRSLDQEGVLRFEAHSLTHPNLTLIDDRDCWREIAGSKEALERELGRESLAFSYPGGFVTARERSFARKAGFRYGITCEPGLNTPQTDPHLIRRIQVNGADRVRDFAQKVRGSHDRPLPARRAYRRLRYGRSSPLNLDPAAQTADSPSRALIVSSFVLPHVGGIEQFVSFGTDDLRTAGWNVRVLSSSLPDGALPEADVVIRTIHAFDSDHPIPYGGLSKVWREVGRADVVVANQHRNLLPILSALIAQWRRRPVIFVIHGTPGVPLPQARWFLLAGHLFERTLGRHALRRSIVVSLSESGMEFARELWHIEPRYVPFPIRILPTVESKTIGPGEQIRAVWAGRLHPQKDPELAVRAVEAARARHDIVLEMYGDGVVRDDLVRMARDRPWLVLHESRTWAEIQEIQASAHFCILSSRAEGTCLTALEPLSRGIPVVGTAVGDIGRHLGDELARFATTPDDPQALAAAISDLCQNYDDLAPVFVQNGERLRYHHRQGPDSLATLAAEVAETRGSGATAG